MQIFIFRKLTVPLKTESLPLFFSFQFFMKLDKFAANIVYPRELTCTNDKREDQKQPPKVFYKEKCS